MDVQYVMQVFLIAADCWFVAFLFCPSILDNMSILHMQNFYLSAMIYTMGSHAILQKIYILVQS